MKLLDCLERSGLSEADQAEIKKATRDAEDRDKAAVLFINDRIDELEAERAEYMAEVEKAFMKHYPDAKIPEPEPKPTPEPETPPEPIPEPVNIGNIGSFNVPDMAHEIFVPILAAGKKTNKIDLQRAVADFLGIKRVELLRHPKYNHKPIEEAMEYAVVIRARQIIDEGDGVVDTYQKLKQLYAIQPALNTRSATSTKNQAYSTPVHLAYLMQKMAGADQGGNVYEPTAGTGMLLTTVDPSKAYANEIDETRRQILIDQFHKGGRYVTNNDGRTNIEEGNPTKYKVFDVVMANPPFGKDKAATIQGFKLKNVEHKIMANALDAMTDDGAAAFIIGGHNFDESGKMPGPQQTFKNWLYHNYKVEHNIEIPGSEYGRQGTTYPVRVFIVKGRDANPDPNYFGPSNTNPNDPEYQRVDSIDELLVIGGFTNEIPSMGAKDSKELPDGEAGVRGAAPVGPADEGVLGAPRRETDDGDQQRPGDREGGPGRDREPGQAADVEGGPGEPGQRPGVVETGRGFDTATDESAAVRGQQDQPGGVTGEYRPGAAEPGEPSGVPEGAAKPQGGRRDTGSGGTLDDILNMIDQGGEDARRLERPEEPPPQTDDIDVVDREESGVSAPATPEKAARREQTTARPRRSKRSRQDRIERQRERTPRRLRDKRWQKRREDQKTRRLPREKAPKPEPLDFNEAADLINSLFDDPAFSRRPDDFIADDDARWLKIKPYLQQMWDATVSLANTIKERAAIFISQAYEKLRSEVQPYLRKFAQTVIADEIAADESKPPKRDPQEEKKTDYQVTYRPKSKGAIIDETLIPVNMRDGVEKALEKLEADVGPIDDFVRKEAGFRSKADLYKALSADQIDGVGLAIWNIKNGNGMIVGDQTGVGKGRIAATVLKWAQKQGQKPIFFTEKPNLFNDFYRDIRDIGHQITPFLMASNRRDGALRTPSGEIVVLPPGGKDRNDWLDQAASSNEAAQTAMQPYDSMLTTYSQIRNPKYPRPTIAIGNLGRGNYFVLDESHNASGESNTGSAIQEYLQNAQGVLYLSATYAKRPDTMPVYSRTSMGDTNMSFPEFVGAVEMGGTPLQEWVSSALSSLGQYVRREKSFEGINTDWRVDTKNRERDKKRADDMTQILRHILSLDSKIHTIIQDEATRPIRNAVRRRRQGEVVEIFGITFPATGISATGSTVGASVNTTSFASVVHNAVRQLMFSMKADEAVARAIAALKDGRKPFIALANTMESFLEYAMEEGFIGVGDNIDELTFADVMRRHLSKVLTFKVKLPNGDAISHPINPAYLPQELQDEIRGIKTLIEQSHSDLPGSPIDHIRARLAQAGYTSGELTGRDYRANIEDPAAPIIERTSASSRPDRNQIVADFNNGDIDVLIANQAGSTGLSAHAGPDFKDQRPRRYIGAQAELNVDTEVQKMGRINRKAQVALPDYEFLFLDLPMEIRPAAVLRRKMASLNANTSAKADSPLQQKEVPDMLNRYGDRVVGDWVASQWPGYENSVDGMVSLNAEDDMMKTSGRIAVAPTDIQEAFYDEVEGAYSDLIQEMKDLGTYDLESEDLDFKAITREKETLAEGDDETTPFKASAIRERLSIVNPRKPYTYKRVEKAVEKALGDKSPEQFSADLIKKLEKDLQAYFEERNTDALTEEQSNAFRASLLAQHSEIKARLARFIVGDGYGIRNLPGLDGHSDAVLLDIKHTPTRTGSPGAPSKWKLTFAVNNAFQRVVVPMSKIGYEANQYQVFDYPDAREYWDKNSPKDVRTQRYVITGNLLQGYEKAPAASRIIRFSMEDGTWRDGILLPLNYNATEDSKGQYVRVGTDQAYQFAAAGGMVRFATRTGAIRTVKGQDKYRVWMPRTGAYKDIYQDSDLNRMAEGEFSNSENQDYMAAYFPGDMLNAVIKRLAALGQRFDVSRDLYESKKDDTAYSRRKRRPVPKTPGMRPETVTKIVDTMTSNWENAPDIKVVAKQADLPKRILDQVPPNDLVDAVIHNGEVYIVAENARSTKHVQDAIVHEALGHYGIRQLLGNYIKPVLMDVYRAKTAEVKKIAEEYGFDISTKDGKLKAADEWLARQSVNTGWFKRLARAIRRWLQKHAPALVSKYDADDAIADLIEAARGAVVSKAQAPIDDEPTYQDPMFTLQPGQEENPNAYLPEEVAARIEAARGVPRKPWNQRMKENWAQIKAERQHFPKLATVEDTRERHQLADILRRHQEVPESVRRQAFDMIKSWTKDLDQTQYEHFRMNILLADLVRDISKGLYHKDEAMTEEKELPFGFEDVEQMLAAYAANEQIVNADETLKTAVEARKAAINDIKTRLVRAKLLKKEVMKHDDYFHHQVLMHWNEKYGLATGSQDVRTKWRPWMTARVGSALDYNTEYTEAEFMAVSQQLGQLETVKTLERIKRLSNILADLKQLAKGRNIANLWQKLRHEGRIEHYPRGHAREGQEIDPLLPYKQKIAMSNQNLAKMAVKGELEYDSEWDDLVQQLMDSYIEYKVLKRMDPETTLRFDHPRWFHFLTYLISKQKPGGNWAATIYKAIRDRNKFIRDELGEDFRTYKNEIPPGYKEWKPEPNKGWFWANTIADQDIQKVMSGEKAFEDVNVRKLLARGRDQVWVIPQGLANQLDNFYDQISMGSQYGVGRLGDDAMRFWKQYILINPYSLGRYNLNNMSGDLDIVLAYDPKILKYGRKALKDLVDWHGMKEMPETFKAQLDEARKLGVIGSGFSVQEVDDVLRLVKADRDIVETITGDKPSIWDPRNWPRGYWKWAQKWTALRENILRLAAYRYFLDHSDQKRYGASKPDEIDAIRDKKEKAAKLARELIGDYGNLSHTGGWIRRRLMPFYSWMEINAPRYVYMMRNTKYEKRQAGTVGRMVGVGTKKTAIAASKLAVRAAGLYAAITLWNSTIYPFLTGDDEAEEELGESGRNQLHIILGRREDGSIMTLRFQGALSDALSFFGLEDFPRDVKDVVSKERTLQDKLIEAPKAFANRMISGLRPDFKGLAEVLSGRSFFPDAFNPRPIRDTYEHILRTFKLERIYQELRGRPRPGGGNIAKRFAEDVRGLLVYSNDPGEQAYWTTRKLIFDWKAKQGTERPDASPTRKGNAMYYYKKALRYGDLKAAAKYLDKYYSFPGTSPRTLKESLDRAHPLAGVPADRRKAWRDQLSKKQAAVVSRAINWYNLTYKSRRKGK